MLLSLFFSSYLITQCLYLFLGGPATDKGKQLGRLFVLHCIYYFWIIFCVESVHRRYHWQLQPSQTTGQKIKPIHGSVELINDVPEIYRLLFQSREGVSNDDRLELFESQSERARSNKMRQHNSKMNRASWKEKKSVSGVSVDGAVKLQGFIHRLKSQNQTANSTLWKYYWKAFSWWSLHRISFTVLKLSIKQIVQCDCTAEDSNFYVSIGWHGSV